MRRSWLADGAGQNQRADGEDGACCHPDGGHDLAEELLRRVDDLADLDGGDEREFVRDGLHEPCLSGLGDAFWQFERGQCAMRRSGERVRREHHDEIDGERFPIDFAEAGDLRFDIAAEHVDGDLVADLQAKPPRRLGVEGNKRRPRISLLPPASGDDDRTSGTVSV